MTDLALLPQALDEAAGMLRPALRKDLFVLLCRTLALWKLPDDWDDLAPFYVEALEDCPPDLVQAALRHVRLTLKWFPKPCELREPIVAELERRRAVLTRLRTLDMMARRQAKQDEGGFKYQATVDEKAAVERMMERAKARKLAADASDDDETFAPCPDVRAAYGVLKGTPFVHRPAKQPGAAE
jgi:hypothetical protein